MGAKEKQLSPPSSPLVEVMRGEMVESIHRGFIAVVDVTGRLIAGTGDLETGTYFRSAAKPFQCLPIISSGAADHFNFTASELAVISGSHSGEAIHIQKVNSLLGKIGLTEAALQCGAHLPFDEATAKQLVKEGKEPQTLHNNCSGKHAGLLGFARFLNAPLENYLAPSHPVQQEILQVLARFAGMPSQEIAIAIDGCSAPVFGMSIERMALTYAKLVAGRSPEVEPKLLAAAERVVQAMTGFPEMVGGTKGRLDTDLMLVTRGEIVSKVGAEGLQLLGVRPCERFHHGLGIAIKIEDGDTHRARSPVVIETLRQLGLLDDQQLSKLSPHTCTNIYNHRQIAVGKVRTCFKIA